MLAFKSVDEFLEGSSTLDRSVPIYIDSNLGNGIRGEVEAKRLFDLGFKNIYLATGYEPDKFPNLPYLSGVVEKEPVF
jgi:hypothetical protein